MGYYGVKGLKCNFWFDVFASDSDEATYALGLVTAKPVLTTKNGISDLMREVKKTRNIA